MVKVSAFWSMSSSKRLSCIGVIGNSVHYELVFLHILKEALRYRTVILWQARLQEVLAPVRSRQCGSHKSVSRFIDNINKAKYEVLLTINPECNERSWIHPDLAGCVGFAPLPFTPTVVYRIKVVIHQSHSTSHALRHRPKLTYLGLATG